MSLARFIKANHSIANAVGAANGQNIAVPGIRASDVILGIIREKAGEIAAGVNTSTFSASAGTITSASVSTDGYTLTVIWIHEH